MSMMANRSLLWAAALVLPLIGFGYSWATTHALAQQGEEWLVPVEGYDPRDLLRGHFIQYQYDWPIDASTTDRPLESVEDVMRSARETIRGASALCIIGKAPNIASVRAINAFGSGTPMALEKGCAIVARATYGTKAEVRGLDSGILYVSQDQAAVLQDKLRDPKLQGLIRVKIRADGVMRPIGFEFRARPASSDQLAR